MYVWIGGWGTLLSPIVFFAGGASLFGSALFANANHSEATLKALGYLFSALLYVCYVAYLILGVGLWKMRNWARSDELEDFELARSDAELVPLFLVTHKGRPGRLRHLNGGYARPRSGEANAEPDTKGRKDSRDERRIQLHRVLDHQKPVFGEPEDNDERAANQSEDEHVTKHKEHLHLPAAGRCRQPQIIRVDAT